MQFAQTYFEKLTATIQDMDKARIDAAIALIETAWKNKKQIFTLGNGGSAATASHYICDWNKGISYGQTNRIRGICLNDNLGTLMAYANDVSYEVVFVEQLKNFLNPGDLVIGISGSGNSPNVLRAIEYANENGAVTLGLCGYDGGKLKSLAQHHVWVPVRDMQIVEDLHLTFGHMVMQKLCGPKASC